MNRNRLILSPQERIILSNQYRILEALHPRDADAFKRMQEIVDNGYELHYDSLNVAILECKMTEEQCEEVMDILDMYRALHDSHEHLKDKKDISKHEVQFEGFDGNGERGADGYLGYARFLILTERRWEEVQKDRHPGFDLNSHCPVIEMYRRMLATWKTMDKKRALSLEEIKLILAEKIHPENRK
jgi:uncharacterized protein YfbU (UPF0304 family)